MVLRRLTQESVACVCPRRQPAAYNCLRPRGRERHAMAAYDFGGGLSGEPGVDGVNRLTVSAPLHVV